MSEDSRGPWIKTFTGKRFHLLNPTTDEVDIESIAHALATKCRYQGQCQGFYSVAEHCVIGADLIRPEFALAFLLHELSETYLPDVNSPLKPHLRWMQPSRCRETHATAWSMLERTHDIVMREALGVVTSEAEVTRFAVKDLDRRMFNWEAHHLVKGPYPEDYWLTAEGPPISPTMKPHCWSWEAAERNFLQSYARLKP